MLVVLPVEPLPVDVVVVAVVVLVVPPEDPPEVFVLGLVGKVGAQASGDTLIMPLAI